MQAQVTDFYSQRKNTGDSITKKKRKFSENSISEDNEPKRRRCIQTILEPKSPGKPVATNVTEIRIIASLNVAPKMSEKQKLLKEQREKIRAFRENLRKLSKQEVEKQDAKAVEPVEQTPAPAFERFHTLAQPECPSSLLLPLKFQLLDEMFLACDTVVSLLHNRKESCSFAKIKKSVQQMIKRDFSEVNLGQIRKVYPEAYRFELEKQPNNFQPNPTQKEELTVYPCFDEDKAMSAQMLLLRRMVFHARLVNIVKEHHKEFLRTLDPPIEIPDDQLRRWHPRFAPDQVPDIEPALLPSVEKKEPTTISGLLGKLKSARTERVLQMLATKPDMQEAVKAVSECTTLKSQLRGVSQSLLAKIKEKEAKKVLEHLSRSSSDERKSEMISRLPELARVLNNICVIDKKHSYSLEQLAKKLGSNFSFAWNEVQTREYLELLKSSTGNWLDFMYIGKVVYVKIDSKQGVNSIINGLRTVAS